MTTTTTPTADLSTLPEAIDRIATLVQSAKHQLTESIAAQDKFNQARNVTILALLVDDELTERFPTYGVANTFIGSGHPGVNAVGEGLLLKMFCDAPDLLQLAVQRFTDEYRAIVLEGRDIHEDTRIWQQ